MPYDTGKTIVSKELDGVLDSEEVVTPTETATDSLAQLPWVTVKIKSIAGLEASIPCTVMMIDLRSVTLGDFPLKSAFGLLRESRDGLISSIEIITEVGTFSFDGKSEVSVSTNGSSNSIVSLLAPRVE